MVYYRKYRPQTINDLDSASLRQTLTTVLSALTLPHAFLFTGPKGLGKTSTARIVAKAVNCENRTTNSSQLTTNKSKVSSKKSEVKSDSTEPCNHCVQCTSITNGSNLDILEIDAASNRGIDEIRDLREKARLAPVAAKMKVYIIDEVHMLTTEAFNALLKTLEEPPAHVLFILCTTESHKIPATIFSRCFHVQFRLATAEELTRSFRRIAVGEKLAIDDDALATIAKLSDGSFRDGAKVLEEVALLAHGKQITQALIEATYKITSIDAHVTDMLSLLKNRDTKEALQLVSTLTSQGVDSKYFITQLITKLHAGLLQQLGVESGNLEVTFSLDETKQLVDLLSKAFVESKYAVLPQLPLEMVVIAWGQKNAEFRIQSSEFKKEETEPKLAKVEKVGKVEEEGEEKGERVPWVARVPQEEVLHNQNVGKVVKVEEVKRKLETSDERLASRNEKEVNGVSHGNFWKEFIEKVNQENKTLAGVLRGSHIGSYDEQNLLIETQFSFHKERLADPKALSLLEKVAQDMTGKSVSIRVLLKA